MWFKHGNSAPCFLAFCLLAVFFASTSYSSDPTPNYSTMDLAAYEAKRRFGNQSAPHFLETFYDIQGAPAVHLFLVTKGQESIPENIGESIDNGMATREDGNSLIQNGQIEVGQRLVARSKALVLQENHYGTLLISAKEEGPSLIAFHHGLPARLIASRDAEKRVEVFSKGENAILLGVLYLSPLEYYFEFEVGDRRILASPFGSEIILRADLERGREDTPSPVLERHVDVFSEYMATDSEELRVEYPEEPDLLDELPNSEIISDVPDYNQRPWLANSCGPTAGATLLGYWDTQGYEGFVEGAGTYDDVTELIEELSVAMAWDPLFGVYYSQIPVGLRQIINDRGYGMDITNLFGIGSLGIVKQEIIQGRPFIYGSQQNPWGQAHYVVAVGYQGNFIIVRDNWWSTPVDYFVSWDALGHFDDMMTVLAPEGQGGVLSEPLPSGLGGSGGGCFISTAMQG